MVRSFLAMVFACAASAAGAVTPCETEWRAVLEHFDAVAAEKDFLRDAPHNPGREMLLAISTYETAARRLKGHGATNPTVGPAFLVADAALRCVEAAMPQPTPRRLERRLGQFAKEFGPARRAELVAQAEAIQ